MNGPLEVTVYDGSRYHRVTRQTHGLKFTKSAPGGNKDASCNLWVDPSRFADLGPTDRLIIDSARTGRTLWDGYLNNPGEQSGEAGLGFDISALGGMVLASDRSERFIWRDTSLDGWTASDAGASVPSAASAAAATREVGAFPDDAGTRAGKPAVFMQFPRGMFTRSGGIRAVMSYQSFADSAMLPGAITFFSDQGANTSDFWISAAFGYFRGPYYGNQDLSKTGILESYILPTQATSGDNPPCFVLWSGNNLTVPSDDIWTAFGEIGVLGQLVDRYGHWKQNPRTAYVLASEVAEDLLGRILTTCDPGTAVIDVSSYPIDSLAYLDATTPAAVFDDLLKFEPDFDWGIGAMLPTGKHRFWFRKWATEPRYVFTDADDIELPGSDDTLCNRVPVVWTDEADVSHVEIVTAVVPELDAVGRIRDAEVVTLPDGLGSQANAQKVGAAVLANANARKVSGSVVVGRPVLDRLTGRHVMPWELEPGWPARLQTKGVNVRVTEMEYDDDAVAATLTLNTPERDTDDVLTDLKRGAA